MAWVAVIGAGGALAGGLLARSGGSQSGTQQQTTQQQADPRMQAILYGDGTAANPGILSQYQGMLNTPQSAGSAAYGNAAQAYMQNVAPTDLESLRGGASTLLHSQVQAPTSNGAAPVQTFGATPMWNKGESYSAPDAMQAARVGAPQQVAGAQVGAAQVAQPQGMVGAQIGAAQVNAPAQNGLNLTGAYDKFINGDSAANPYLTGAIGKGINQSQNAFDAMQQSATDNLQKNILPGIRSNSVLSGQYGGSRQGIAEGNAIGDMQKAQQQAISQFGQNNTDAAVTAQSGQFNSGQDRALAATQGLSGQQYGVASQNAALTQQANMANQASTNQAAQTNFGGLLSGALANAGNQQQANSATAGYQQQANLANQGANQAADTTNAGLQQQANSTNYGGQLSVNSGNAGLAQQANMGNQAAGNAASTFNAGQQQGASATNSQLQQQNNQFNASQLGSTNALNSNNQQAGLGALGSILQGQVAAGQNQDQYALQHAQQVNGLLTPYLGVNGNTTTTSPLYSNTAGNVLGGAAAGLGIANRFGGLLGGNTSTSGQGQVGGGPPGTYYDGHSYVPY